jgi:hypothetical protein
MLTKTLPFFVFALVFLGACAGLAAETPAAVLESTVATAETLASWQPGQKYTEWFSDKGRVFPPLLADPREAKFRLGFGRTSTHETIWDFGFGADVALLRAKQPDGTDSSFSVRGLINPRFQFEDSSFKLQNTDFIAGLAYGWAKDAKAYEFYFYHESSHLGDQVTPERERIDYSRETLRFLASQQFDKLRLYGGPSVATRILPSSVDGRLIAQGGAEYKFDCCGQSMYTALDLQSREENDWAVNATLHVGVELGDPKKVERRHKVFVELFTGHSNMGQFFNETESYVLLGVEYTFK